MNLSLQISLFGIFIDLFIYFSVSVVFETGRKSESASSWGLHRPVVILSSVM